jgi:hypothetical protein
VRVLVLHKDQGPHAGHGHIGIFGHKGIPHMQRRRQAADQ